MTPATPSFPLVKFETANRSLAEARRIFEQRIADAVHIYGKHHQNFRERPCPFCDHGSYDSLEPFHGTFGISQCHRCAGVYVNPAPNLDALVDYYNNCACNLMLQELYKKRSTGDADLIMDERVQLILSHLRTRLREAEEEIAILEVGCGSGRFLANLRGVLAREGLLENVRLTGVDIDRNAVAMNTDPELELYALPVEEFSKSASRKFDIVLHFELIEHLTDPATFMSECKSLMKSGGIMLFTTPNANGFELVASGYNSLRLLAHGVFPPMHLNAFSTQNVSVFLLNCGFSVKSITTPGNLDADMVSLLKDEHEDAGFVAFAELPDAHKGLFQHLLRKLGCSSHMMVVASP